MASSVDERNSVISNLRACLISSQGGIRMDLLNRDYMQIIGEYIPFKRLGYSQLVDFLKSVPEITVKHKGADIFIEAKEAQSSSHVTKLVARQKRSGKKKSKTSKNVTRYVRIAPRLAKRIPRPPLISSPTYCPQRQCYLPPPPLQISVPLNSLSYNDSPRVVNEVNELNNAVSLASSILSTSNHGYNLKSSPTSKIFKRNHSESSIPHVEKSLPVVGDNSERMPGAPTGGYKSIPLPPEANSKKIKQSAQNRLTQIKKQNKLLVSVYLQHGESTSPYQRQLSSYIQERGWEEPAYKVLKENSGKRVYYCTLSIFIPRMAPSLPPEAIECGTFSNDFYDVNEAKECVAKQALEKLKKREVFSTYPIIQDPNLIIQRVDGMIKEKDTGKWASRIEDEHRILFKEILPSHWLDIILTSDQFIVEELANSSLLIKAKENAVPFLVPADSTIPKLILPDDSTWDVFVTRAVSVSEVCLRFIGDDYSGMLDSLTNDMEMWYQEKEHLINPFLVLGEYYAAYCNESWARVIVLKINIDDIHVKFIDHGDEDVLPRSVLYKLEPKFMTLPAQAVTVSLKNLEPYRNSKEAPDYLKTTLVGNCLIAIVEQRTPKISLTLFDTSQEEAVNVNEKLKYLLSYNYKEKVIIEEGNVYQVYVTFIDEAGTIFLQIASETLNLLLHHMEYIEAGTYDNYRIKDFTELLPDKIYLLDQNNEKYRVKVVKHFNMNGQVLVNFIDSGGEDSVFIEDLYNLEEISYLLYHIPPQVIATHLHEVPLHNFNAEKMLRIKDMLFGEAVIVAKIRKIQDGVPIIELFKRTVPQNLMASINQTLILDSTLNSAVNKLEQLSFKSNPKSEKYPVSNLLLKISNNFPSGSIERIIAENRPVLPDIGEEFQVLVQQTANPSFIMIQPLEYVNIIRGLEKEMCEFYNIFKSGLDPKLREGSLCAVRDKSCWYRAYVDKIIDSESVSVKLLDYGSVSLVLNTDIKPLKDQFLKIPFVGFCCKIHGIIPKHGDWNVDDCLKTRVLIDHKKLTAQIKGALLSHSSLGGTILELQLFDINNINGNRQDIGDMLVQKGCAKYENLQKNQFC